MGYTEGSHTSVGSHQCVGGRKRAILGSDIETMWSQKKLPFFHPDPTGFRTIFITFYIKIIFLGKIYSKQEISPNLKRDFPTPFLRFIN